MTYLEISIKLQMESQLNYQLEHIPRTFITLLGYFFIRLIFLGIILLGFFFNTTKLNQHVISAVVDLEGGPWVQ